MRFIILGGGCYGSFYVRQLLRARANEALAFNEIVVVDHNQNNPALREHGASPGVRYVLADWDDYLDQHLRNGADAIDDQFVPSPFNPHLALGWLMRDVRDHYPGIELTLEQFSVLPATRFKEQRAHGTLVASHADWICPVHCIEPDICPHTRGTRDWDMDTTGKTLAELLAAAGQPIEQVHLFHCHHVSYGVGAYSANELVAARSDTRRALRDGGAHRFLVGTVSHCHGAFHILAARHGMDTVSRLSENPGFGLPASRADDE